MKLTSWNLRGLNSPVKYRMIKNMIQQEKPHIFFMQETKCNSNTIDTILAKAWPGSQLVAMDASGASGGLAIAWDTQAISLLDFHANHNLIQATFHIIRTNIHGHLTNVYFPQDVVNKLAFLRTIARINSTRAHPLWIAEVDFNMITKLQEKNGGQITSPYLCNGKDLATPQGDPSTLKHFGLPTRISVIWSPPFGKVSNPQKDRKWNQMTFGNIFQAQRALAQEMMEIQQTIITEGRTETLIEKEKNLQKQLDERRKQEEILWRQKSRVKWLKEGKRNTKLFHRTTIQRRIHNNISQIQNQQGERMEQHEDIERKILQHFKSVHQEPQINRQPTIEKILQHIPKIITEEHNQLLLRLVTLLEVETAMNQLKEGKAPGPNGFTSNFFHKF
eukprot:PITA_10687